LSIPFLKYEICDPGFIPIVSREGLWDIRSGFLVIRFAALKTWSRLVCKFIDVNKIGIENYKMYSYVQLSPPFNNTRYKDVFVASFPGNGQWLYKLYFTRDEVNFSYITQYTLKSPGTRPLRHLLTTFHLTEFSLRWKCHRFCKFCRIGQLFMSRSNSSRLRRFSLGS
jgi:hypothetical protein